MSAAPAGDPAAAKPVLELVVRDGAERGAAAAVGEVANDAGVEQSRVSGFQALIEELIRESLAREHAMRPEVRVRVLVEPDLLEVELHDDAIPVSSADSRRAHSRRLAAAGAADELHIRAHGKAGNLARCAIDRSAEPSEESAELASEQLADDVPVADEDLADGLEIRPMEEADAAGLVRCVYRTYGYTYKTALMYEPRSIVKALRRGRMHSVVAVTPAAGVIGHSAVFYERAGDEVPEAGRLVVDPRFRGHGIANRMSALRRELATERGVPGYWSEAVTNHPYSQREIVTNGGAEVGLLIGGSPPFAGMLGFDDASATVRGSLLAAYTPLNPTVETIHPPERHAPLIAELVERVGLERDLRPSVEPAAGSATAMSSSVEPSYGVAHLRVGAIGAEIVDRVADELDSLEAFDLAVVHLDLSLCDPAAGAVATSLEQLGFCLAAWIPRFSAGSDGLRLQRIGSHPVDTETVVCARPEGEALRDYVIADYHRIRRLGPRLSGRPSRCALRQRCSE